MSEASIPKTTFNTRAGKYARIAMPFGLTKAPSTFLSLFKEWLRSQGYCPLSRLNEQRCRSFFPGSMPSSIGSRTPCGFDGSYPLTGAKGAIDRKSKNNAQ